MDLWEDRDSECRIRIEKGEIRIKYPPSLAAFRHNLLLLVAEGIVSFHETENYLEIELTDWNFDSEGCPLC